MDYVKVYILKVYALNNYYIYNCNAMLNSVEATALIQCSLEIDYILFIYTQLKQLPIYQYIFYIYCMKMYMYTHTQLSYRYISIIFYTCTVISVN